MNPSFLHGSGIVPTQWELTRQPQLSSRFSQLVYNSGVSIVAHPNRLLFVETLSTKSEANVEIPEVASRYVETLPNLDYQAVGINFRSHLTLANTTVESNQYVSQNFLIRGEWLNSGIAPVQTELSLVFTLEGKRLYLTIQEATIRLPDKQLIPVVLFTGNFDYQLGSSSSSHKIEKLQKLFTNWHQDLENYLEIVNKFITAEVRTWTVAPMDTELETTIPALIH
jgi:hypothetical protein